MTDKYIITDEILEQIRKHSSVLASRIKMYPYNSQSFDESTGRGYRCIHCEVRNDVQFCHYHDVSLVSEQERMLNKLLNKIKNTKRFNALEIYRFSAIIDEFRQEEGEVKK